MIWQGTLTYCALGRSSLTDRTCSSHCLVAGAEGIRTAGPLALPRTRGRVVTRVISTRSFKKTGTEKFYPTRYSSHDPPENERIFERSPKTKRPKRDRRFESPLLQQRGTANRRSAFLSGRSAG